MFVLPNIVQYLAYEGKFHSINLELVKDAVTAVSHFIKITGETPFFIVRPVLINLKVTYIYDNNNMLAYSYTKS